jgi:hypothetical protein
LQQSFSLCLNEKLRAMLSRKVHSRATLVPQMSDDIRLGTEGDGH